MAAPSFTGAGGVAGASLTTSVIGPAAGPAGPSALRLAGAGGEEISSSGAPAGTSSATGEEAEPFGAPEMVGALADAFGVSAVGALAGATATEAFGDGEAKGVAEGASAANAPTTATKMSARARTWRAIVIYFCFGF